MGKETDINSIEYAGDAPPIAETDLSVTVIELCKAEQYELAATEIEIAVRRAYQVEGAA